jgi:cysteine desulfurase family protein
MKKHIYLNNSATSYPKPECVIHGVTEFLRNIPVHHARTGLENEVDDLVTECRRQLAVLFSVPDSSRIVFSSGATESLNTALFGLDLLDKEVITTAVEHNSVLRPLKTMEKSGRIKLSIVKCDTCGLVRPDSISEVINDNTGAIVINHCSNVTGIVNDIEAIGKIAQKRGIPFVVDASQSAGVYPIDVQEMNIDILVFTGHKSLYGIQGVGGAYIRDGLNVQPLKVGGTGIRSDYLFQPEDVPILYEAGTQNLPGIVSLYHGVRYILEVGIDRIREMKVNIVSEIMDHLVRRKQVTVYPIRSDRYPTTIFSFNIDGLDPADISYILENNFGITVRSGLHCAPLIHQYVGTYPSGSVRVSPSHFTTWEEIEIFNNAVDQIVQIAG